MSPSAFGPCSLRVQIQTEVREQGQAPDRMEVTFEHPLVGFAPLLSNSQTIQMSILYRLSPGRCCVMD